MVLSEWKNLNSNISFVESKKKFFNKFYYNVKYFCPGGRIVQTSNIQESDIPSAIQNRIDLHRFYNYGGSWRAARESLRDINHVQLKDMLSVKTNFEGEQLRLRVEEPFVTIYSVDEQLLLKIAGDQLKAWADKMVSVTRPKNDDVKKILDSGAVIVKTDPGYRYKFVCRDGKLANKDSIYQYLLQLDKDVKVSRAVLKMLSKPSHFSWGIWFYGNDPSIANVLNIIEPNFVSNIHEVVVA